MNALVDFSSICQEKSHSKNPFHNAKKIEANELEEMYCRSNTATVFHTFSVAPFLCEQFRLEIVLSTEFVAFSNQ